MSAFDLQNPGPELLLSAYCQGIFPMADPDTELIHWYRPDPRAIIPLDAVHIGKKLARLVRRRPFEIRCDSAFEAVIEGCGLPREPGEETWISEKIVHAYGQLFETGHAHSVEAWLGDTLVGGLYGVHIGGLFCGESMFFRPDLGGSNASKVCFVHLVRWLGHRGFALLDAQMKTPHTERFGCVEISASEYQRRLTEAVSMPVEWGAFEAL